MRDQTRSLAAAQRLAELVPGGAHTYAKGPDQYPADLAPIIARGQGAHVWDVDGNEYVEYGSGLRSVILGHAHPRVLEAVRQQLAEGSNFVRPAYAELEAAEAFLDAVPTAEMVKFAKNGSDVTTAALRLARAITGRDAVAICATQPFFSTDDWFIGDTPMPAGIPRAIRELTVEFPYGDLAALDQVLAQTRVALVVLEAATQTEPPVGYLQGVIDTAHRHGALVLIDEMITGLRWDLGGAAHLYGIEPDFVSFGKALANGFSVSALGGKREYLERGGLLSAEERVFLLSTTHGAEGHGLAAMRATLAVHREEGTAQQLAAIGTRLRELLEPTVLQAGLSEQIKLVGLPQNLVFATLDETGAPSQAYRTLFMRALLLNGVCGPSFVPSTALTERDLEVTRDAVAAACVTYRRALDEGDPTPYLGGRPVKPVFRPFA